MRGRRGRSPSRERGHYGRRDAPTCLLVRNLSYDCRPEDLRGLFGQFGPIEHAYLPRDYYSGDPRGFGFVQYFNSADAAAAKHQMDGTIQQGQELDVSFALKKRKRSAEMRARERRRYSRLPPPSHPRSPLRGRYSRCVSPHEKRYSRDRSYSRSPAPTDGPSGSPIRGRSPFGSRNHNQSPGRGSSVRRRDHNSRSRSKYSRDRSYSHYPAPSDGPSGSQIRGPSPFGSRNRSQIPGRGRSSVRCRGRNSRSRIRYSLDRSYSHYPAHSDVPSGSQVRGPSPFGSRNRSQNPGRGRSHVRCWGRNSRN